MQIRLADSISILTSGICLIHCLATPLLLVVGYGPFIEQEGSKYIFVIISFLSIFYALKDSSSLKIGVLLWTSFWIFLFSIFFHEEYTWLNYSSYLGSVGIIIGHILNIKKCKKCQKK